MKTRVTVLLIPLLLLGLYGLAQEKQKKSLEPDPSSAQQSAANVHESASLVQPDDPAADPKLYYNPFSEKLYIEQEFHTTTRVSIRMVDAKGRKVYEMKDKLVYPGLNKMVVSLLESLPGAYFVHINAGDREYIRTLVTMP